MRSHQIFAGMSPEHSHTFLRALSEEQPGLFAQALAAASAALKSRPVYLTRQPFEKQADAVRRALSRVAASPVAEEILAAYFLECRKELLAEWLDALGIEHEEGVLKEDPTPPDPATLEKAVATFRAAGDEPDRELLLRAFAAQSAVEWPKLEDLIGEHG